MDLITSRFFTSLTAALLIATAQPLFAECAVAEYDIEVGQNITIPLSPLISVHIDRKEESISLGVQNGGTTTYSTKVESDWVVEPDWDIHQVIATDVTNDGVKELLIGLGRGMVSTYYTMLIFNADGALRNSIEISAPEFCKTDHGFHSWYRSGPRGIDIYWAINAAGIPYRKITQTIVDDVVSHRVVYVEDGGMAAQTIVPNELDILAAQSPFAAAISGNDGDVTVYDPKDSQREIALLAAGAPVVLLGADDTYSLFLIEYDQGKRGWIMLEDVAYD